MGCASALNHKANMNTHDQQHQDIRDAIRDLCAQFPDEYFRKVDQARGYPEEFVNALTQAGWMAALIPQEYGGSGLGLTEASVIMEEINRCGGNSGACHGQLYNMGTLLRHGSTEQKNQYLPKIDGGHRTDYRHRHHKDQNDRCEKRRSLCHQRAKGLDFTHSAFGLDDFAGAHDPA